MNNNKTLDNLKHQFDENINSHVFLFETDDIDLLEKDIKELISYIIKADANTQKQIMNESYIEQIIIRPTGKYIIKDDILTLQSRLTTKPIIGDKLFYIISSAEKLNDAAANKLLKTIEEPSDNTVGYLLTTNTNLILPTIKSRCQIEKIYYKVQDSANTYDEGTLESAKKIILAIESKKLSEFIIEKMNNQNLESNIKENTKNLVNIVKSYYNNACNLEKNDFLEEKIINYIKEHNSKKQIMTKVYEINTMLNNLTFNMNSSLLINKLILELSKI